MEEHEIRYSMGFDPGEYRLVELPEGLTDDEAWADGAWVKGGVGQEALLCTRKRTYAVNFLESSNTQMLLDDQHGNGKGYEMVGDLKGRVVLCATNPRIDQLRDLLKTCKFSELSEPSELKGIAFEELVEAVQASESEIKQGLEELHALKYGGSWFSVDENDEDQILSIIADALSLLDIGQRNFDPVELKSKLPEEFNEALVDHCLNKFFEVCTAGESRAKRDRIRSFYAEKVLRARGGSMGYESFLGAWVQAIPEIFLEEDPKVSSLAGTAIEDYEKDSSRRVVRLVSKSDLPSESSQRMKKLFSIKALWAKEELEHYFDSDVESLLVKHAKVVRTILDDGTTFKRYRRRNT
mmetsp:Transcript_44478/g.172648  ORF Transcript_44478/g.172648 Transcript_44478/m.172648 type:complete len:353 (-) Transcript_44478:279-1337(-)|eukprot:CAMPEP_0113954798 /NCGR_PEP_ID=MMETSP0011_2-20120614/842_1 /TAXON_ID=101924 /ORGANISM="Rhodosorus marinus" /LENGTH=352 /DNA_ID=CAMNT_0000964145 /DNA_START=15 /DNA_END=1073 /DNA_ORIENTATION=- /assembly_acc=CAM_ASM_000156